MPLLWSTPLLIGGAPPLVIDDNIAQLVNHLGYQSETDTQNPSIFMPRIENLQRELNILTQKNSKDHQRHKRQDEVEKSFYFLKN